MMESATQRHEKPFLLELLRTCWDLAVAMVSVPVGLMWAFCILRCPVEYVLAAGVRRVLQCSTVAAIRFSLFFYQDFLGRLLADGGWNSSCAASHDACQGLSRPEVQLQAD